MLLQAFAMLASVVPQESPPVPGGCVEPASANVGKAGCFLSAQITLERSPATLYWHIVAAESEDAARAAAHRREASAVVLAHGRWWLYVLSPNRSERSLPAHHVAGPFNLPSGKPIIARFMESWFPPGMRTRVHSHSGPEAFYVIEGEQCTATPAGRHVIKAGESYIVPGGSHLQAAPNGRRSVVLILAPQGEPWMRLTSDWTDNEICR